MKKNIFETWSSDLPDDQCLYSLYDFDILIGMDGMSSSRRNKIGFIFWAPSKSKIKDRMILASAKDNLTRAIEGIQIEWQLNGRDDLDVPDFIEKLGQQPGIRHAGEIIGFEGQSVKVWQNWTSTARDLSELHGTDRSNIPDYYDKMKARMKENELLEKKRAEERQSRSERLKKTPSLEDRVSSYGRFTYDAAQRSGTAANQVQNNQVQNLNKYSSGVTSSLSKYAILLKKTEKVSTKRFFNFFEKIFVMEQQHQNLVLVLRLELEYPSMDRQEQKFHCLVFQNMVQQQWVLKSQTL